MPIGELRPDSTVSNTNWVATGGVNPHIAIDDDPQSPDDADYAQATSFSASMLLGLSNTPSDFVSAPEGAAAITLRTRFQVTGWENDTYALTAIVLDSIGGSMTNEVTISTGSNQALATNESGTSLTTYGIANNNKTTWDGCRIRFSVTRSTSMGADALDVRIMAAEISMNYTAASGDATVPASTVAAVAAVPAPTVKTGSTVAATAVAAVANVPAPTVTTATHATVTPATVAAVASVPAPTVQTGTRVNPATVAAIASQPAPSVSGGARATPPTVAAVASQPAPSVRTGSTVAPAVVAAVAAQPTPTVQTGSTVTAVAVAAVADVPAPTVSTDTGATISAATVAAVAAVPAPSVSGGATVKQTIATDDFNRADASEPGLGAGWDAPRYSIVSNRASRGTNGGNDTGLFLTDMGTSNMTAQVDVVGPNTAYSLLVASSQLTMDQNAIVGFLEPSNGRAQIAEYQGGLFSIIANGTLGLDMTGTYTLRLEIDTANDEARLYHNGTLVCTADITGRTLGNYAGLSTATGAAPYDNFQVTAGLAPVEARASVPAPTVSTGSTVPAVTVTAVAGQPLPVVSTGSTIAAAMVAAAASIPAPTVSTGSTVLATAVAGVATVPPPTIQTGSTVQATAVAAVADVPAPTVDTANNATVNPDTVAVVAAVGAPTVSTGSTVHPTVVAITASVGVPTILAGSGATITPATVAAVASIPAPVVATGSTVLAAVVAAVAAVPPPSVSTGSVVAPATVAAAAAVAAVTVQTGSTVVATSVGAIADVPAPNIVAEAEGDATVFPATVAAVAAVGAPIVSTGSTVTATTVAAIATVGSPTIIAVVIIESAGGARTAWAWDGSTWERVRVRVDQDGALTGFDAPGWVWDGSDWRQFQPPPDSALLAPENLAVIAGDVEMDSTWDLPVQPVLEPTDVQVRIPELTTIWTELPYPTTAWSATALTPSTLYQLQVRLIRRAEGQITHTSETASVFFTTTAPDSPGFPAPDPGGSGSDSIIDWPILIGGGPVGGPGCWWEYVVQQLVGDETISDFADVVPEVSGSVDGDIGSLSIDPIGLGLDCGQLYRFRFREVCDGVPGDWNFGVPFLVTCDWSASCGGIVQSPSLSASVMADAAWAIPKVCTDPDIGLHIEDAISGALMSRLPGLAAPLNDTDDEWCLLARDFETAFEPLLAGPLNVLSGWDETQDFTTWVRVRIRELNSNTALIQRLANSVLLMVAESGSGYVAQILAPRFGGGALLLASTTELAFDEPHLIQFRCDADGVKDLWVDHELEDTDSGAGINMDNADLNLVVSAPPNADVSQVYGWDRALTDDEMAGVTAFQVTWSGIVAPGDAIDSPVMEATVDGTFTRFELELETAWASVGYTLRLYKNGVQASILNASGGITLSWTTSFTISDFVAGDEIVIRFDARPQGFSYNAVVRAIYEVT